MRAVAVHGDTLGRAATPADATVELMHLALMDATEWRVLPGSELEAGDAAQQLDLGGASGEHAHG